MNKPSEYNGIWQLPSSEDNYVTGKLSIDADNRAILEIIGHSKDIANTFKELYIKIISMDANTRIDLIYGLSTDNIRITLYDSFVLSYHISTSNIFTIKFLVSIVFVGIHFSDIDSIKFNSIYIHYFNLDEWANVSGFNIDVQTTSGFATIQYKIPEPILLGTIDNFKYFLSFDASGLTRSFVQKEATIQQTSFINIVPQNPEPFDKYNKPMYHIRNLLTLLMTIPTYSISIYGFTEANKVMVNGNYKYPPVDIYLQVIKKENDRLLPPHMLSSYYDIQKKSDIILNNWFKNAERLESVYDLYFATLFSSNMYDIHEFLSLIQALESYHRGKFENPSHEEENKTRYSHIYDIYQDNMKGLIADKDKFIQKILDSRNYYTHYDPKKKQKAAEGLELLSITAAIKMMIESCLLEETGFDKADIKNLITKNKSYQFLRLYPLNNL